MVIISGMQTNSAFCYSDSSNNCSFTERVGKSIGRSKGPAVTLRFLQRRIYNCRMLPLQGKLHCDCWMTLVVKYVCFDTNFEEEFKRRRRRGQKVKFLKNLNLNLIFFFKFLNFLQNFKN